MNPYGNHWLIKSDSSSSSWSSYIFWEEDLSRFSTSSSPWLSEFSTLSSSSSCGDNRNYEQAALYFVSIARKDYIYGKDTIKSGEGAVIIEVAFFYSPNGCS